MAHERLCGALLFTLASLMVSAKASSTAADPLFPQNGNVERKPIHFPEVDVEVAAELGNSLISKKYEERREWVEVARDVVCDPPGKPGVFMFHSGGRISYAKEDQGGLVYDATDTT